MISLWSLNLKHLWFTNRIRSIGVYCLRILSCCSKRHYNSQDKCGFNKKLSYLVIASCSVCNFLTLIVDCSPPINDKVCNYINYPNFASKESKTSALNSCNLSKGFMQIKAGSISSIVTSQYGINMFHSIPSEMGFQRPIVLTIDPIQSALLT